ncbi:hypothetical protein L1277_002125 [Okibacterium sp. HSC-33S16]|uniref:HNH endonuclease signature motif containing protein n=1 Tax=Okibacterium sp. HSC-33S16 TaxID=2910965 RepID=UPI0020A22BC9|nr:HNH endonuclease signature motif containing protein [Okibacterium sp. HSC-33S16]MCP2032026.1 hypothetical protein [Okibacterium sp. HSC-33S16]
MTLAVSDFPSTFGSDGEAALTGLLSHLGDVLDTLDLTRLQRLTNDQLLMQMSQLSHVLRGTEAALAATSAEVAVRSDPVHGADGLAARHTYQRPSQLIEAITGVSSVTAGRLIRVGSRTSPRVSDSGLPLPPLFPAVGEALSAGLIGVETAEAITRELSLAAPRTTVENLSIAEQALVGQAVGAGWREGLPLSTDLISIQARQWRDRLDEDGAELREKQAFDRREFWIARQPVDGLLKVGGQVTIDVGAKLHALLDAILSPHADARYVPSEDSRDNDGYGGNDGIGDRTLPNTTAGDSTDPESASTKLDDHRTAGQKRADVFAAMIDALARSADVPTVTGASPTVVVTIPVEALESGRGSGQLVGVNAPVPASTIRQVLCDATVVPVFIDPDGAVVALGNMQRKFNRMQRMGMIARDGPTCCMPDCQIPASGCEAHHILRYSEGGPTDIANGALFCWFHHRMIDLGVFTVTMVRGKPKVTIAEPLRRKPYFR